MALAAGRTKASGSAATAAVGLRPEAEMAAEELADLPATKLAYFDDTYRFEHDSQVL